MPFPRRRPRRPFVVVAAALAAAVTLGACAGSGYVFAASKDGQAFFRIPASWRSYGTEQMLRAERLVSPGAGQEYAWVAGYDSDPHPSVSHVLSPVTDYPIAYAYQRDLNPAVRDGLSLFEMRNLLYSVDQGIQQGSVRLVDENQDLTYGKRFFGARYVFDIVLRVGAAGESVRVEQTVVTDVGLHHVYVQEVACRATCFVANQKLINQIVASWTLKER